MAKTKKTARPVKLNNKSASDNEIRSQLDRKTKAKKALRKAWWFIWEDDSIWSWIANIVLAFVLIKFIVYPGLGLILGTNYPIVAVVSGSMEHDGSFDDWWSSSAICSNSECSQEEWYNNKGISKSEFLEYKLKNGFNKGDIVFLKGAPPEKVNTGDILVFMSPYKKEPIIHRIVQISENNNIDSSKEIYLTKGDNNVATGKYDENIREEQVLGKAWFKVPYLGWIKIGFVNLLSLFGIHVS